MSTFIPVKTRKAAVRRAPWAAVIVRVEGGFLAFASPLEYEVWSSQK